jgi:hypothetical protein
MKLTWWSEKTGPGVWDVHVVEDRWVVTKDGCIERPLIAKHTFEGLRREREMAAVARRLVVLEEMKQGVNDGNET